MTAAKHLEQTKKNNFGAKHELVRCCWILLMYPIVTIHFCSWMEFLESANANKTQFNWDSKPTKKLNVHWPSRCNGFQAISKKKFKTKQGWLIKSVTIRWCYLQTLTITLRRFKNLIFLLLCITLCSLFWKKKKPWLIYLMIEIEMSGMIKKQMTLGQKKLMAITLKYPFRF